MPCIRRTGTPTICTGTGATLLFTVKRNRPRLHTQPAALPWGGAVRYGSPRAPGPGQGARASGGTHPPTRRCGCRDRVPARPAGRPPDPHPHAPGRWRPGLRGRLPDHRPSVGGDHHRPTGRPSPRALGNRESRAPRHDPGRRQIPNPHGHTPRVMATLRNITSDYCAAMAWPLSPPPPKPSPDAPNASSPRGRVAGGVSPSGHPTLVTTLINKHPENTQMSLSDRL